MAVRRDALLAIGGFNPIYLRAGDDVDVCWRLQARGGRIGFAPAALVWHHHRASIGAYWRQQVGYGEGEVWLQPHHPDKFVGSRIQWRGHVYSPLPFVRSLFGTRVNAGPVGHGAVSLGLSHRRGRRCCSRRTRQRGRSARCCCCIGLRCSGAAGAVGSGAGAWPRSACSALAATIGRCLRHALASDIRDDAAAARPIGQRSAGC